MKKLIFSLMMICMMLMSSGVVFADVYMPQDPATYALLPLNSLVIIMLSVSLIVSLVCVLFGKKTNSENLVIKAKKYAEIFLYYILVLIALSLGILVSWSELTAAMFFILIVTSLFFRLKNKNKKNAYAMIFYVLLIWVGFELETIVLMAAIVLLVSIIKVITRVKGYDNISNKAKKITEFLLDCILIIFELDIGFFVHTWLNDGILETISILITHAIAVLAILLKNRNRELSYTLLIGYTLFNISFAMIAFPKYLKYSKYFKYLF